MPVIFLGLIFYKKNIILIDMKAELQKQRILQKILQSSEFNGSQRFQDLLKYLFNSSIEGNIPKETTIALEVLGKDKNFDPSQDTIVRYYMHNLRKKLDSYYQSKGKKDSIRLVIPKGHYEVQFIKYRRSASWFKSQNLQSRSVLLLPILILLIFFSSFLWYKNHLLVTSYKIVHENDPIWRHFLQRAHSTLIVFGDPFLFSEYDKRIDRKRLIRDGHINSQEKLQDFITKYQTENRIISNANWELLPMYSTSSLQYISPLFFSVHKNATLESASKLEWQRILNNDIIYIGSFRYLYNLSKFITGLNFKTQRFPAKLYLTNDAGDTLQTYETISSPNQDYDRDYAVVAKLPGPNDKALLFFMSFHHIGVVECVKKFTDPDFLSYITKTLSTKHSIDPENDFFYLTFEVEGFKKIGFTIELKHAFRIDPDFNIKG